MPLHPMDSIRYSNPWFQILISPLITFRLLTVGDNWYLNLLIRTKVGMAQYNPMEKKATNDVYVYIFEAQDENGIVLVRKGFVFN